MSPCFYHSNSAFSKALRVVDLIEFMLDYLMPNLIIKNKKETVAVIPVCYVKKLEKQNN
jgi:glycerol-3-phosphate dehydrogenase subunit C